MKCEFCSQNAHYRDPITGEYVCPEHARINVVGWRGTPPRPRHEVREAAPEDSAHILRIANYFWGETEVECFDRSYDLARIPALLSWAQERAETGLAAADEAGSMIPIGFLSYVLEDDRAVMVLLNVFPDYQGLGIASQLIHRLCEIAREAGLHQVVVATSNDDIPALSLYQRLGFRLIDISRETILRHHGREEAGFGGIPVRDEIHLAMDLGDEPAHGSPTARGRARPRIGLALSGGAARGIAHLGVLEVLEAGGIRPDYVAGVSAGAVVGALYCAGVPLEELMTEARKLQWLKVGRVTRPGLGFFNIDRMAEYMDERFLHGMTFDQLPIPFAALAADLRTGEEVLLREGKVSWAVRTSCALPGAFTPVVDGERILVDGGVVNNVPVSVARRMGADYVIAVDVLPPAERASAPRNMFEMWSATFYMLVRATHTESHAADCVIYPKGKRLSTIDFSHADRLVECGRQAALQQLDRIRRDLGMK